MGLSWVAVQKAQAKFPLAFNPLHFGRSINYFTA